MNRRFLLLLAVFGLFGNSVALAADRPNIVFLYTDDQAPWAQGLAGNADLKSPNLDRMFSQGAYLVNAFAPTPVCSPARASLMTSMYGTELGITDWINPRTEPDLGLDPATVTWPEVLASAGYTNGLFGKWHLGTQDKFHPTKTGFHKFVGFREGGCKPKNPVIEVDGQPQQQTGLLIDILTEHAIKFIREQQKGPFMMCLHYRSPHAPWLPVAEDIWDHYEPIDPVIPNPDYPDLDVVKVKNKMREYLASVASVDRSVGRIMGLLDELKLADNTIVVFTSDHGYNMGHNGIWHKGNGHWILKSLRDLPGSDPRLQRPNLYDNSLRVPAAVRWPGVIKPGTVIKQTICNMDFYPTLLAMTIGVAFPENVTIRGHNFLPLLRGKDIAWDNDLYAQYSQHHYVKADLRSYRTPEWKLVRDFMNAGKDELYHLAKDPAENTNLIASTEPEALKARKMLEKKLLAKMQQINDPVLKPVAQVR